MKYFYFFVPRMLGLLMCVGIVIVLFPSVLYSQGSISGIVFNDLNTNAVRDPGEPGIRGRYIRVVGPVKHSMYTDDSGRYSFDGLPTGSYTISEDSKSGWAQTMPPSPGTYNIQISSETPVWDTINFGNRATRISGIIFYDLNGNGRRDPGEPGIKGWHINAVGRDSLYARTNDSGEYSFDGVRIGSYTISEGSKSHWTQTMPPSPGTYNIQISNETPVWDTINFGNYTGKISGIKFNDLNRNGRRDEGEPGIKGWRISISGTVTRHTNTNDSGGYTFDNLPEGIYIVSEVSNKYWAQTLPPAGYYPIFITNATPVWENINFGNYAGRISGIVFNDLNGNGRRDEGEPGIKGWQIQVKGPRSRSTSTNASGVYLLDGLPAGDYIVSELLKVGWAQTVPLTGGYNIHLSDTTPDWENINFGNYMGMRFDQRLEGMGFKIPTDAKLMTSNLACDTGNSYVCGYSNGWDTKKDYVTIKYSHTTQSWVARYNNATVNKDDMAYAITLDKNDGSVYVTGESDGGISKMDIATVKYNAAGDLQWVARWNNTAFKGNDAGYAIALNPTGTAVFVAGETFNGNTNRSDYVTLAYDAQTGAKLWEAMYNGSGRKDDKAYAIAVGADGNPIVTGESDGGTRKADYATIMYDGTTGAQLWVQRYDGPVSKRDYAFAVKTDGLGNVYVTGASEGSGRFDYATIKYSAAGELQWERRYDGAGKNDFGYDLALDSSGNVYVTGASQGLRSQLDYATIKYDPTGVQVWVNRYGLAKKDIARSIDVCESEKKIFVTGSTDGGKGRKLDCLTQKIDANTGATDWITMYNGIGYANDIAYSVRVRPGGGSLVITGTSNGGKTAMDDFITIQIPTGTSGIGPITTPEMEADEGPGEESDQGLGEMPPAEYEIAQNYPNPFNPTTTISFLLPEDAIVTLKVYNTLGQEVATLIDNEVMDIGEQRVQFNAGNLASGVYFYRLKAASIADPGKSFIQTKKMLLMK